MCPVQREMTGDLLSLFSAPAIPDDIFNCPVQLIAVLDNIWPAAVMSI
jgi:hypothetical protein